MEERTGRRRESEAQDSPVHRWLNQTLWSMQSCAATVNSSKTLHAGLRRQCRSRAISRPPRVLFRSQTT
uniref:Uncharacterized protein n=1 Tax=Mycena chlorophos TaxID=658473 RepID=A0ABQ0LD81_MYCCL|nr:predicted protein [Mycena chlorophos]